MPKVTTDKLKPNPNPRDIQLADVPVGVGGRQAHVIKTDLPKDVQFMDKPVARSSSSQLTGYGPSSNSVIGNSVMSSVIPPGNNGIGYHAMDPAVPALIDKKSPEYALESLGYAVVYAKQLNMPVDEFLEICADILSAAKEHGLID